MKSKSEGNSSLLIKYLKEALINLSVHPYPHIDNPKGCPRRASVSLIIRIRPNFDHWPANEYTGNENKISSNINQFFNIPWVKYGDPEIAFIKRAARDSDRWTSHVALPGGKRDPEDMDDKSVAIRETLEEIGLDLSSGDALYIGNLPERLISSTWGTVPMMILCPFVFLWTKSILPPLKLQPGEVASAHWVPLRTILSPFSRTFEYVDTSDRFTYRKSFAVKILLRSLLGLMKFPAIRLSPSESLQCTSTEEFFPKDLLLHSQPDQILTNFLSDLKFFDTSVCLINKPLLLWGLTLGIIVDFLNLLPPHKAVEIWSYPNFTNYDVRLIISLLTMSLKKRNKCLLENNAGNENRILFNSETEFVNMKDYTSPSAEVCDLQSSNRKSAPSKPSHIIGIMLEGYYDRVRRGAALAICLRVLGIFSLVFIAIRYFKNQSNGTTTS